MSRRWLSIWLPEWPIERMTLVAARRGEPLPAAAPLVLVAPAKGVPRLHAVSRAAARLGLRPGMALADARAAMPGLVVRDAEPWTDRTALASLALWCQRWSPKVAPDGDDGLLLDLTGVAHLWGGEAALLDEVAARLARLGLGARLGIAGRQLAGWAWARFGAGGILAEPSAPCLAALPTAALRLPEGMEARLARLGLRRVGDLDTLPRASLLARFGETLPRRLNQLLGAEEAPFTPLEAPRRFSVRIGVAEPIARTADIEAVLRRLVWQLATDLERAAAGASSLQLAFFKVDGSVETRKVRLGRPSRDLRHIARLLAMRLDGLDAGFGIEAIRLDALETAPLAAGQAGLAEVAEPRLLERLTDQLGVRLGEERVLRLVPVESHAPERAVRMVPAARLRHDREGLLGPVPEPRSTPDAPAPGDLAALPPPRHARDAPAAGLEGRGAWVPPAAAAERGGAAPRPLRLLERPIEVDAVASLADGPPRLLREAAPTRDARAGDRARSGRALHVVAARGPERILPEWWRPEAAGGRRRDLYDTVLDDGRRLWLAREGGHEDPMPPVWRLLGSFD